MSRFCPQCGRGVEPAFRFCPACGGRLPPPPLQEEETEKTAPAPPRASPARPSAPVRPSCRSPRKPRPGPAVPLPAESVLTDQGGRQWRLVRLLDEGGCGLTYEGAVGAGAGAGGCPGSGPGLPGSRGRGLGQALLRALRGPGPWAAQLAGARSRCRCSVGLSLNHQNIPQTDGAVRR